MSDFVLEWIGYIASSIVLISLLMSSIKKLRWINLVGALTFGFYGFMIGSIPTGLMNVGIVLIDVYYLVRMYRTREFFRVLPIKQDSQYLKMFLDFYKDDILLFKEIDIEEVLKSKVRFFILRNMSPAGIFVADEYGENQLEIKLDYVIPQYRDFKIGNYVFDSQKEYFESLNYKEFVAFTEFKDHIDYVKRMGFVKSPEKENCYIKSI